MAETSPAANNKPVAFGMKPAHEPAGAKKLSPAVRKSAKRAIKRGMISAKAASKHLGEV